MDDTVTVNRWGWDYPSITDDCSPGLVFLRDYLIEMDKLDADKDKIKKLLGPYARLIINGQVTTSLEKIFGMLDMRQSNLAHFQHKLHEAYDIPEERGRTVIFESTSTTVFKGDTVNVEVLEFTKLSIEVEEAEGAGVRGWQLAEAHTYMDPAPVKDRAAELRK